MREVTYINMLGVWTLFLREVRRFIAVYTQTIIGPIVTSLLFLAIFALALGGAVREIGGIPFLVFLAPGLVMMVIAQNAFANTSSSIVISKVQGNIVDTLMPPLTPLELTIGIGLGGTVRGVVVGIVTGVVIAFFVPMNIAHVFYVIFHAIGASLMLSLLGLLSGIWSEKFDHIAGVTNFIVTPLSFLSGTFYSIHSLPPMFQTIALFNPFFYMIDGFRYGFIGVSDVNPLLGLAVVAGIDLVLWASCQRLISVGYRLKS